MNKITDAVLITSGDLRQSANLICWDAQADLERRLTQAFANAGCRLRRAFPYDPEKGHGFIDSQRAGMNVFSEIESDSPIVFATAAWQYTHHVLPGLRFHQGPILTVANWSGRWPGLVGLLNLNGSLVKAGIPFSSIWSEHFEDNFAINGIDEWLQTGVIKHDHSHVHEFKFDAISEVESELGIKLAAELLHTKAILGVFDEGCMGMYNAIVDDELMNRIGIFKERLSQSMLYARMQTIREEDAQSVRHWLNQRGLQFNTGMDEATELTDQQILLQCKMYIACLRIAHEFGCDAVGIQYQQGLKDLVPASDLVEGLLNNPDRPPAYSEDGTIELFPGSALPHFNEVDECAGVDAVITNRCWRALGFDPSTTLHDVRWGETYSNGEKDEFVWLWQISGAAPSSHFIDGYRGSISDRQPAMYFPLGGGTLKGIGRPGSIVWSRVFIEDGTLRVDMGLAKVMMLPHAETMRRWNEVTPQWPMLSVVMEGVSRDQFMSRHRANHVSIAYVPTAGEAKLALNVKAAMFATLGVDVYLCGIKPE